MFQSSTRSRCFTLLVLFFALFASAILGEDGLVTNGDFETPPATGFPKDEALVEGATEIPGWKTNGTVELVSSGQKQGAMILIVPRGAHAVRLGNDAEISQELTVEKGSTYSVTFSAARTCAQLESLNVSVPPASQTIDLQTLYNVQGWDPYAWAFEAAEDKVRLVFTNPGMEDDPTCGPIIDDIAIKKLFTPDRPKDNAVINGDYEEGPWMFANVSLGVLLPTKLDEETSSLPGWIVESNSAVRYIDSYHYSVPQGKRAIELHSGKEGIISQMVLNSYAKELQEFHAECAALVNIRHRNLVRVVTSCSSIDFQGNDFKAIVYELMVNGSLEEWLHPVHQPNNAQEMRSLNLIQKLNISIDVANALNYLHQHCETPVVHCDLKPSNVLLNAEMTACVGDFGLARLRPEVSHQLSSGQTSSVGLKGTVGYAAPDNAVINGDYEEGPWMFANVSLGVLLPTKLDEETSSLPGWIVESNRAVRYIDSYHYSVPQGKRAIELLSGKEGIISQMVETTPNKPYTMSFALGHAEDKCKQPLAIMAFAGDQAQNIHYTPDSNSTFQLANLNFTAKAERTRIAFYSVYYNTRTDDMSSLCGPVVDDVRVWFSGARRLGLGGMGLGLGLGLWVFAVALFYEFCFKWSGVTCGRRHQRVVELDLHSYKLVGGLSPSIGNLSFLRLLNLENNSLSSSIPGELGRLFRLQMLRLGNNSFSGEIPANISSCANLIALRLEGNNLTGKLPEQLESLSKLKVLNFESNNLVGEIPPSFGNLSSIVEIGMRNDLKGVIPHSIGRLKRLEIFSFGANNLSGTIPPSIFNLSTLTGFAVPVNQLHGTLPPDLGHTLPNLETLLVHTNRFSGLIPMTISNASNLSAVELGDNFFTGKIPSLGSLPNLWFLSIGHNYLGSGQDDDLSFLYSLENNTVLEVFDVYANHLGGVLPEILGNFSKNLRIMAFGRNQIRGTIPDGIGNLVSLAVWAWNDNKISGSIPSSVGNMTSLIEAYLDLNNLHGSIPSNLGNCRNLLALGLSNNNLSGSIPKELLNIPSGIFSLNLSENHLTGSLPLEVGNLVHLGELDVSKNRLSASEFEGEFFQRSIPESLSSSRALKVLDLSHKIVANSQALGD
uniref:Protein kinase domain-containing protein n=1 Tax=Salix viminalis TaxID=40686 RepID=A0A6N2KU18_SALVM